MTPEFLRQIKEQTSTRLAQLSEMIARDKVMVSMDGIALEAIRLKIQGWDQLTFAELREKIKAGRFLERHLLLQVASDVSQQIQSVQKAGVLSREISNPTTDSGQTNG